MGFIRSFCLKESRALTYNKRIDSYLPVLCRYLEKTDIFAEDNVKQGRGGPFGAALLVLDRDGLWHEIGNLAANAVLSKGIGSAHAESEVLSPENVNILKEKLLHTGSDSLVVIISSGESCPACHAKEEILARILVSEGLLSQGNVFVVYGASYGQTEAIAGFNDKPYLEDMQKDACFRLIKQQIMDISDLPAPVRSIFETSTEQVAVICQGEKVSGIGHDQRRFNIMATSEVVAIWEACLKQKKDGTESPWDLGGAVLYTPTPVVGPLEYAESLWANITRRVSVNYPQSVDWATQEVPDLANNDFFQLIASRPYNEAGGFVTVLYLGQNFKNRAQYAWKEKIEAEKRIYGTEKSLYNGVKPN